MVKEELREFEPVIYQILQNALNNNRVSHFYLLAGARNPLKLKTAFLLAQSIIENRGDFACEECNICKRIAELNYFDFYFIDGAKDNIKKEDIDKLEENISLTALEGSKKVALISNIENGNSKVWNMLLKRIEEPSDNTYMIMTTDEIDTLLATIKSRAQIISFSKPKEAYVKKAYEDIGFSDLDAYLLSKIHSEFKKLKLDDEAYSLAKELVKETINSFDDPDYIEIMYQKRIYDVLKNKNKVLKDFLDNYLRLLLTIYNDALSDDGEYEEYRELIYKVKKYNVSGLLEGLLDILSKSDYNYDRRLLLDELAYKMTVVLKGV